jgi:WD40 repeat protein
MKRMQKLEITSVCFDKSGRRLITGSRDGVLKMWNYNNGQILKRMYKNNVLETSDIAYIEMVLSLLWDRAAMSMLILLRGQTNASSAWAGTDK